MRTALAARRRLWSGGDFILSRIGGRLNTTPAALSSPPVEEAALIS
jgi:hypothetical protein